MKIDEVITKLEKIKNEHGNIDVKCLTSKICWSDGHLVSTCIRDVDYITTPNSKCVIIEAKEIEV